MEKQTYMKTETCKLESFEHLSRISSKSILIISSYNVLRFKVGAFFRDNVYIWQTLQTCAALQSGCRKAHVPSYENC